MARIDRAGSTIEQAGSLGSLELGTTCISEDRVRNGTHRGVWWLLMVAVGVSFLLGEVERPHTTIWKRVVEAVVARSSATLV